MSASLRQVMIKGEVQGVGYRAWVEHQAVAAGLEGWVRNRSDGSVEAVFAGSPKLAAEMVALCRHGPPSAKVASVLNEATHPDLLDMRNAGERFSVLPTA